MNNLRVEVHPLKLPDIIKVHLGHPDSNATNYSVRFDDYLKLVCARELNPQWLDAAIEANILYVITFTLYKMYVTYRNKNFDITNDPSVDLVFHPNGSTYENIDHIIDRYQFFYIRKFNDEIIEAHWQQGTCPQTWPCCLEQINSGNDAKNGYSQIEIIRKYCGADTFIEPGRVPVDCPNSPLIRGSRSDYVSILQNKLNKISERYREIPRLDVDGIFGAATESAVRIFQRIFGLEVTGIVNCGVWKKIGDIRAEI